MPILQFQPLSSRPTPSFWTSLTSYKLDKARLNDSEKWITGWLEEGRLVSDHHGNTSRDSTTPVGIDGALNVGGNAFGESTENYPAGSIPISGILKNFNTVEEFRKPETKKALFEDLTDKIVESFDTENPIFNLFLLVTFADLKKYKFHYWFAFPAIIATPAWTIDDEGLAVFAESDATEIRVLEAEMQRLEGHNRECFLVKGSTGNYSTAPLGRLRDFMANELSEKITVAFHDPSSSSSSPGWNLRNILYYLQSVYGKTELHVLCLRSGAGSRRGLLRLAPVPTPNIKPVAVGWERSKDGKLSSRIADLGSMMDPIQLAAQAVDLNLKLMKWRISPSLDLGRIAETRCLLLGAGTLGCYVARNLMAWGVRNITFVDSSTVSFSNPVRQPLFRFEDCLQGGQPKAICASERLKEIFPGVNATGRSFTIPMPGHPIPPSMVSTTREDIEKLENLISQNDVVFLLTDSRESRWLPTLLGKVQSKIVINAALGFDTYLVMRHGSNTTSDQELGCYFCNDVVAPTNSLTDRTLDQMCTVTRPGVAPLAAACATELLVTLLQHPLRLDAPAYSSSTSNGREQDLPFGEVPHQIRGSLNQWSNLLISGPAYKQCTACSSSVLEAYRNGGVDWLLQVFSDAKLLERVTGLDELHAASDNLLNDIDWQSDSSEGP